MGVVRKPDQNTFRKIDIEDQQHSPMADVLRLEGGSSRAAICCGYAVTVSKIEFAPVQSPPEVARSHILPATVTGAQNSIERDEMNSKMQRFTSFFSKVFLNRGFVPYHFDLCSSNELNCQHLVTHRAVCP